jgi:hypothetical protein
LAVLLIYGFAVVPHTVVAFSGLECSPSRVHGHGASDEHDGRDHDHVAVADLSQPCCGPWCMSLLVPEEAAGAVSDPLPVPQPGVAAFASASRDPEHPPPRSP